MLAPSPRMRSSQPVGDCTAGLIDGTGDVYPATASMEAECRLPAHRVPQEQSPGGATPCTATTPELPGGLDDVYVISDVDLGLPCNRVTGTAIPSRSCTSMAVTRRHSVCLSWPAVSSGPACRNSVLGICPSISCSTFHDRLVLIQGQGISLLQANGMLCAGCSRWRHAGWSTEPA